MENSTKKYIHYLEQRRIDAYKKEDYYLVGQINSQIEKAKDIESLLDN